MRKLALAAVGAVAAAMGAAATAEAGCSPCGGGGYGYGYAMPAPLPVYYYQPSYTGCYAACGAQPSPYYVVNQGPVYAGPNIQVAPAPYYPQPEPYYQPAYQEAYYGGGYAAPAPRYRKRVVVRHVQPRPAKLRHHYRQPEPMPYYPLKRRY